MNAMTRWTLKWAHGEATIQALGGMLGPVRFELGRGQSISPLHVAPWGDDARRPGLMRAMRGEWPCLPFGTVHCPSGLPPFSALPTGTGPLDVTLLPLTVATEEILQIAGCQPPFVLRYAASGADVLLDWNVEELPDALLWISNGGRTNAPWCGRNFALGVEPANSFFDLGRVVVPPASHPLAARSGLRFLVEEPRTIRYRLSVRAI
jgi:hypothetical protein